MFELSLPLWDALLMSYYKTKKKLNAVYLRKFVENVNCSSKFSLINVKKRLIKIYWGDILCNESMKINPANR